MGTRSKLLFVPHNFVVPKEFETDEFRLRMLSIDDVEKDFDAVTSSEEHVGKVWPDSDWPQGLTLRQNLIDLGWHEKEFQNRSSFAYTMVTLDESRIIGCVYFYPTLKYEFDAEVFLWARKSELSSGLEERLFDSVQRWMENDWPFENPAFPGRLISWHDWDSLPDG